MTNIFEKNKHKMQIYTDYKNLFYFITTKVLNRKQIKRFEETV